METQDNSIQLQILSELKELRKEVNELRKTSFDHDSYLTKEEETQYRKAKAEYERGDTTSLEDFEKELNNE